MSSLVNGVLYIIGTVLFLILGPFPTTGQAFLSYFAGHELLARVTFGILWLTDLMLVPIVLALYVALKGIGKNAMLVASGFVGLFIVLDLGVNILNSLSMVTLSESYAAATSATQRAAYVAAADYAAANLNVGLPIYGFVVPGIGVLVTSLVMLRGIFSKPTAYVGMAAAILGIAGGISIVIPPAGVLVVFSLIVFAIWLLLAGYRLYNLGKQ